ncbi:MAG: hypothetical protein B7Z80_17965 [Rhodospirillales bacterium 20-64-7]|nr:MAG: hypothetical protein B7Z80_17965 [Rhodospirillales bacterium 20-64-7]
MSLVERPSEAVTSSHAQLLAEFDWAATPLGPRAAWPQPLQTIVNLMLASPIPMVTLWGPDGALIYNEGYAEICGTRHPSVLGQTTLEAWPEVADYNRNVLQTCLGGDTLSLREQHLVLQRNGYDEDVWLDVDYSPVRCADGRILGVFCILNEVTTRVLSDWRRVEAENQLALAVDAAELGTWDYDLRSGAKFWSDRLLQMFGLPPGTPVNQEFLHSLMLPEDRKRVQSSLDRIIDPDRRAPYDIEYRVLGADGVLRWVAAKGRAFFSDQGIALRAIGTTLDITARKNAERRQNTLVELGDRLRALETTAEISAAAAEVIGKALDASRAGYAQIEGELAIIEVDWTAGALPSIAGPRRFAALGDTFCAPLRRGEIVAIENAATHPAVEKVREAFLRLQMVALVNVPLLQNGELAALVYVQQTEPRRWTPDEIELVKDVADRTWEARSRARAAQALRALNESLEQEIASRTAQRDRMWRLSSDVMLVADFDGVIESVNPAWNSLFGWSAHEVAGRSFVDLTHPEDRPAIRAELNRLRRREPATRFESRYRRRDGTYLWLSWRAVPDDAAIHAVGRDITAEREQAEALKATEEALRQAQKMEAVGQLTGGIAHDFNNLLQGITGSLDLVEKRLAAAQPEDAAKFLAAARVAAERAGALTHRLLAFYRRQPLDPKPVEANPLVRTMEDLLRRTMGEGIAIDLTLADTLWLTLCDPHQLESAILNLAINARDAMPDGGRLVLETANATLDAEYAARVPEVKPGEYVCVAVTDTGTGMPASVVEQAFEPFFTTKPLGRGTGLGLSMIYGFTKQSGGHAQIHSAPGRGTTVKLFLPRYFGAPAHEPAPPAAFSTAPWLPARVLVVEDEEIVRFLVLETLQELGLTPIAATDGLSGLEILRSNQPVDLLITDIGLPGLNGRQMADAARLVRPALKILFMTGYAENAAMADGFLEPGMALITKPFAIDSLAARVNTMLAS